MADQITLVLVVFTAAVALVHLIYRAWGNIYGGRERNKADNLPPGSTGWPLVGETLSYYLSMTSSHPTKFIEERERRYKSDIFISHLYGEKMVVSADAHFNKFVLQNEGRLFRAKYPQAMNIMIGKYGLLTVHGDLHRKLHGIAVNLLRSERLRVDFMEEIQTLVHSTLDSWEEMKEIFLFKECHQMIINLMAKQLLDLSSAEETSEIRKLFIDFGNASVALPIKIPGSTYFNGIKARELLIKKILETMEERRRHPEVVHHDLLARLMEEGSLSEEIICDFILFLLFAGQTSFRAMPFAIKFLSDCPKALAQMKEEHDAIFKKKGGHHKLSWDDYTSMKFTQCVITETLRLSNLAAGFFREAMEDTKIKGYLIPKGWVIFAFTTSSHLDKKFHEPLTFDPWRWQRDQDSSYDPLYIPFGAGARLCPGYHLAKLELALFFHIFITRFRWETLANDKVSYLPLPHLTKGFPIRLHPLQ
uniref:CYP720B8 n=1 Tax=Picea sitchensis TaxID=3332 RepID=E5FA74_PICSI|nr:CYP720B8 [Picea sitchensis]